MNRHYFYAPILPFVFFILFSLLGHPTLDFGAILGSSIGVREGLMPYRDFLWLTTPLTLYVQAGLQKLFFFLSPVTISVLWKAIGYLLLSFVSLVYIQKLFAKFNLLKEIPIPFIYLYPLMLMFLGPIHETHVGYTPDVLLFAGLGILFMTWPEGERANRLTKNILPYLGYFCLGLSFGFKQEVGLVAIAIGLFYLIAKFIMMMINKQQRSLIADVFIPVVLLLAAPLLIFGYFYTNSALGSFINSTFVIPSMVRTDLKYTIIRFATFGAGIFSTKVLTLTLLVLVVTYLIDIKHIKNMLNYFTFGNPILLLRIVKVVFIIVCMGIIFINLISPNSNVRSWFHGQSPDFKSPGYMFIVYKVYDLGFFYLLWSQLALFGYLLFKLKNESKLNMNWLLNYFCPILFLLLIFDAAQIAGVNMIRGPRIIVPLAMASAMILLTYFRGSLKMFYLTKKEVYLYSFLILAIFFSGRINGAFSAELSSPLHRSISYSSELKCFVDKEILDSMKNIKKIVSSKKDSKIFVYQSEPIFYIYLNKLQPTYSIVHNHDWYPTYLDEGEIKRLKDGKVDFIITHAPYERVDAFLFRVDDPIRDFIEKNYQIILSSEYYYLWGRKM